MIAITVPIRTARGLNSREHHFTRYARNRKEKEAVGWYLKGKARPRFPGAVVSLTRIAPSEGLDSDNLQGALKAVRDAVAEYLDVDDKFHHIVDYQYHQERGPEWGVRIEWQEAV
jgi:hypothetical protein